MRMGKQAKFSPCERMFVWQHNMARDSKPVIQLAHHIVPGGHGEDKLLKSYHNLAFDFLQSNSAILHWPQGKKVPFMLFPQRKVRIEAMQNLQNNIQ